MFTITITFYYSDSAAARKWCGVQVNLPLSYVFVEAANKAVMWEQAINFHT